MNTNRRVDSINKGNSVDSLLTTSFQQQETKSTQVQVEDCAIEEHEDVTNWLHPLTKSLNMSLVIPNSSNATPPDLELTLAAPKSNNMEQDETSKSSYFNGPISVTCC